MRKLFSAAVFGLMLFASAALAGSPDNPGAHAQALNDAKDALQSASGNKNAWGQAVKENNQTGGAPLGQQLQAVKEFVGGAPNPANDKGGGND